MNGVDLNAHGIKEIRIAAANEKLPHLLKIHVMDSDGNISCINLFFKDKINLGIDDSRAFRVNHLPTLTVCGDKRVRGKNIDWRSESRGILSEDEEE